MYLCVFSLCSFKSFMCPQSLALLPITDNRGRMDRKMEAEKRKAEIEVGAERVLERKGGSRLIKSD